jgi:hypothetical protein
MSQLRVANPTLPPHGRQVLQLPRRLAPTASLRWQQMLPMPVPWQQPPTLIVFGSDRLSAIEHQHGESSVHLPLIVVFGSSSSPSEVLNQTLGGRPLLSVHRLFQRVA